MQSSGGTPWDVPVPKKVISIKKSKNKNQNQIQNIKSNSKSLYGDRGSAPVTPPF
jgi:hypothetical protein